MEGLPHARGLNGDVGVEHLGDRGAGGDLAPRPHHLAGPAGADDTDQHAVALVVGQELVAVVFDQVHGVGGLRLAQALDLDVVLVAPEVRGHRHVVQGFPAQHRRDHDPHLGDDVAPVLHPDLVAAAAAPERHIADGPHVGCAGAPGQVAEHSVAQLDAAALQPLSGRPGAHAEYHQVGGQLGTVGQHDGLDMAGAADLGDPDAAADVDAVGPVQPRHQFADLLTEHAGQRGRLRLDQRDIHPELAQAGRRFTADETGADHHRAAGGGRVAAQHQTVFERADHPDAVDVAEAGNAPRHQPGGDDELVIAHYGAVGQRHGLRRDVDTPRSAVQPQVDVVAGVELRRFQGGVVAFAAQHIFGQRRPVIRQTRLVGDDRDRPRVFLAPQLLGGTHGRQAAADDDDTMFGPVFGHVAPPRCGPSRALSISKRPCRPGSAHQ
jgi:hypothetical protein